MHLGEVLGAPRQAARTRLSVFVGLATAATVLVGLVLTGQPAAAEGSKDGTRGVGAPAVRDATPLLAAGSQIVPGSVNRTSISLVATYNVSASVHYGDRAVAATSTISLRNASGGPIDRVELNTVTAPIGGLRVTSLTVDGTAVTPTIDDQTVVVPLGGILPDGASTDIRISIRATLRSTLTGSNWLFTRVNGVVEAARWLPWVSLRRAFNRPNHGDPFITASSPLVRVRITTDRSMVIASTGLSVAASGLSQTFEARNVRDFNFAASPYYKVYGSKVGNTLVRVYGKAGYPASTVLSYARNALSRMGALVGTYPYPTFKVAQSAGGYGMESPQLIWIPGGDSGTHLRWLVHHETAHQWFYGIVGNDQARQPFDDEAAADQMARYVTGIWQPSRCATNRLDLSIYGYSATCYFHVIYIQGSALLDRARQRMGTTAYWRAMRDYVAAHRYGIATTKSLLDTLDAHTSLDLRAMFAPRFPSIY
jgi:hypothetical protein